MIHLVFNCQPTPKGRPRAVLNKKTATIRNYTPAKTRNFESFIKRQAAKQYKETPLEGPISLRVVFYIERPKTVTRQFPEVKPDLDNYIKAVSDALNNIIYKDDSQIVKIQALKLYAPIKPFIEIEVKKICQSSIK